MDYRELIYIGFGSILGFLLGVLGILIERYINRMGKLKIFYKIVNRREYLNGWGFEKENGKIVSFCVPVRYEIFNTSNVSKILRDVSIDLYKDNRFVKKMIQIEETVIEHKKGGKITDIERTTYGGEREAYSFVIAPLTIVPIECEYYVTLDDKEIIEEFFNNIRFSYYDEKNKKRIYKLKDIDINNKFKPYLPDKDWICLM